MPKSYFDVYLNDIEKSAVAQFIENKTMYEAVRKLVLASVYYNDVVKQLPEGNPTINPVLSQVYGMIDLNISNETIGAQQRAVAEAYRIVTNGFARIDSFKLKETQAPNEGNPAL